MDCVEDKSAFGDLGSKLNFYLNLNVSEFKALSHLSMAAVYEPDSAFCLTTSGGQLAAVFGGLQ